MSVDLYDSEFTLEQIVAIREIERKLRKHGFRGAKDELQAVYNGLVTRAQALDEHRLFIVECDWFPLQMGLPGEEGGFEYRESDQLPCRFQGELSLGFENLDYWSGHFHGIHVSRAGFLKALEQENKRVLPPSVLMCLYKYHWQKLAPIIPDGTTITAWGTIFRDSEGRLVWGLTRDKDTMKVRLCRITGEQWNPSQEFALVWNG